jgi:hypothetical protein
MGLEGKLADMPVLDLLRVFQRSARSGKLIIWHATQSALIWFLEGQVVSAVVLERLTMHPLHTGEEAIFTLFTWPDGHFRYRHGLSKGSYQVTITRPTSTLIVEALQRRCAVAVVPAPGELTLQTPLCVLPHMAGVNERIQLNGEDWFVLTQIGPAATVGQLVTQTGLPPERVLTVVAHLIAFGLVMRVPLADLPERQLTVELSGPTTGIFQMNTPITSLTRAIRRRLQQITIGA